MICESRQEASLGTESQKGDPAGKIPPKRFMCLWGKKRKTKNEETHQGKRKSLRRTKVESEKHRARNPSENIVSEKQRR